MSDDVDDLVRHALERIERDGPSALEDLFDSRPDLADDVRERLRLLGEYGLLDDPASPPPADESGRRLGDFRLLRRLGGGGMGVVYLAEQESLGREVAVKLIRSDQLFHAGARARFRREVDLVARLKHPAIVPIHAVGEVDGVPYFAMERIEGCTLEALLDTVRDEDPATFDAGRLPGIVARLAGEDVRESPEWRPTTDWRRFSLETARAVARALEHAHRRGVLHRDVKPSNVMIATDGRVFLADFGLAQAQGDVGLTQSGSVIGSLPYLSPERVLGEPADERADVYGLGATLYEMWTFRAPYVADSAELLASRIVEAPPSSPRPRNRRLSRDDETVVMTALDPDLDRRYRGAGALAEDLDALLHLREIRARPLGPLARLSRLVARHPGPAAAVVLAFLLFVVAPIAFAVWQVRTNERLSEAYDRAVREQSRAEQNLRSAQEAVELILHETASQLLPDVPQMARARERILERAVAFYAPLLAQEPHDRRSRFEMSMMRRSLGDLYLDLSRPEDARREYERQLETLDALLAESDADPDGEPSRRELYHQLGATTAQLGVVEDGLARLDSARERYAAGIAWFDRANAVSDGSHTTWLQRAIAGAALAQVSREQGDRRAADDALRGAVTAAERSHALAPEDERALETLAKTLVLRSALRHDDLDLEGAAADQERALALLRPRLEGASVATRSTHVVLLQNHGTVLVKLGRPDEAAEVLGEARERAARLAAAFPEQTPFLRVLADTWNTLGLVHSLRGDREAAADAYRSAVEVHRRVADTGSAGTAGMDPLGLALANLASAELDGGGIEAAEAAVEEALALLDEAERIAPGAPYRATFRRQAQAILARVRVDQGRFDEAAWILRDVLAEDPRDPRAAAAVAEIWMTIAELAPEPLSTAGRREALDALRTALLLGFEDLESLRTSPSLAPLLDGPELRPLVDRVRRP